jgi:hypothetical protein
MEFKMNLSSDPGHVFNINDDVNLMFNRFLTAFLRMYNHILECIITILN